MSEAMRDMLVAIEGIYRTCGQPLPVIAPTSLFTSDDPLKDPRGVWDSILRTVFLINKDAGAMVARSVGFFQSFSVMKRKYFSFNGIILSVDDSIVPQPSAKQ